MNDNYTEEQSIDILDMLKRLLKKWKLILLAGVICAAAAGLLFGFKAYSDRENTVSFSENRENYSYSAADIAKNLSQEERDAAENAFVQYRAYSNEIALIREQLENSLYLNLGSGNVPAVTVSYLISTDEGEAAVNDIRSTYILNLRSDDTARSIISECGLDTEPKYFAELVSFNPDSNEQSGTKQSTGDYLTSGLPSYNPASNLLSITVCGPGREICESVAEQYASAINRLAPQISKELSSLDFEILPAGEVYFEIDGKQIAEARSELSDRMFELTDRISDMEDALKSNPKSLYEQLKSAQSIIDSGSEEQISGIYEPATLISKKAIVIGFAAGVFIMCAYLCLKYIMGSCIRVKSDISEMFGLTDCVDEENIKSVISCRDYKKVAVLGAAKNMLSIDSADISEADAALLAERIDVSRTADIRHEIDICRQHGVPIIGYIVYD